MHPAQEAGLELRHLAEKGQWSIRDQRDVADGTAHSSMDVVEEAKGDETLGDGHHPTAGFTVLPVLAKGLMGSEEIGEQNLLSTRWTVHAVGAKAQQFVGSVTS